MAREINVKELIKAINEDNPFQELELKYDITPLPYARPRRSIKLEEAGCKNPFYNPRSGYKNKLGKLVDKDLECIDFKPVEGEVELTLEFGIKSPEAVKKVKYKWLLILKKFLRPTTRPDVDNYVKPILDVLNKRLYKDDGQIVALHAYKYYATENDYIIIKAKFRENIIKRR